MTSPKFKRVRPTMDGESTPDKASEMSTPFPVNDANDDIEHTLTS